MFKNILFILIVVGFPAIAQQFLQKQDTDTVNLLKNPGFESSLGQWTYTSGTTFLEQGATAIQAEASAYFSPTSATQVLSSYLYATKGLADKECEASLYYKTDELVNLPEFRVVDNLSSVLTSGTLAAVSGTVKYRLPFFTCGTNPIQVQLVATGSVSNPIYVDSFHLGSRKLVSATDVIEVLGYTPAASTTVDALNTASGTYALKANNLSDLASATVARDNLGLGDLATKDYVDLGTSDVSGTLTSDKGGTGFNTYSTGDLIVGSGTTLGKIGIGSNGKVLKSDGTTVVWGNSAGGGDGTGFNFLSNPTFENDILGYTQENSAGTNGVASQESYAVSSPTNTKYFRFTFGQNNNVIFPVSTPTFAKGLDCEFGGRFRANSGTVTAYAMASGTPLTVSSSVITSQALTLSTDWQELPKVFNPCSQVGDMAWAFAGSTSGTVVELDDLYTGLLKSSKTGAIVGPTRTYTPTLTGFGSATNIAFSYTQRGDKVHIEGSLTAGTYSGVEVRISLPNNWTIKSPQSGTFVVGKYARGETSTNHGGFVLGQNGVSYVVFSDSGTFSNSSINALSTVTALSSNGVKVSFNFEVPVDGLQATGTTLDSQCKTDLDCENIFSTAVGAAGTVTQENLDWINGNCSVATNVFTCNINSGVLTTSPNCWVSPNPGATNGIAGTIDSTSSSQIVFRTFTTTTAANNAQPVYLICQKNGSDFKAKNVMEAYLSKTVTSTGNFIERMERVSYGGATDTTVCSASPCNIYRQSGAVTSVTRSSAGQYVVNFATGTFSDKPSCYGSHSNNANAMFHFLNSRTLTSYQFQSVTDAGGSTDSYGDIVCVGPR